MSLAFLVTWQGLKCGHLTLDRYCEGQDSPVAGRRGLVLTSVCVCVWACVCVSLNTKVSLFNTTKAMVSMTTNKSVKAGPVLLPPCCPVAAWYIVIMESCKGHQQWDSTKCERRVSAHTHIHTGTATFKLEPPHDHCKSHWQRGALGGGSHSRPPQLFPLGGMWGRLTMERNSCYRTQTSPSQLWLAGNKGAVRRSVDLDIQVLSKPIFGSFMRWQSLCVWCHSDTAETWLDSAHLTATSCFPS